jgi:hypothetical protein
LRVLELVKEDYQRSLTGLADIEDRLGRIAAARLASDEEA